jgi:hypothetical protein
MSIVLNSSGGGSITIAEPSTASNLTLTLPASTGTVLTTTNPKTGNVLQVVSTTKTDTTAFSGSNTWWNISGVSASITPSSASNKVLVNCVLTFSGTSSYNAVGGRIVRDGNVVSVGDTSGSKTSAFFGSDDSFGYYSNTQQAIITFLDSPSSTS